MRDYQQPATPDDAGQRPGDYVESLDEAYERIRFAALTPEQQRIYELHVIDQWEAVPSYFNRYRESRR